MLLYILLREAIKKHVYFMASCVSKNTLKLAKFGFGRRVQQ